MSNEYRLRGMLESMHGLEPLPLTPISTNAQKQLESWGVPQKFVTRLQDLASSFRYDLCEQKMGELIKQPLAVEFREGIPTFVHIPHFSDSQGRLHGSCSDIAAQFITALHFTGYLEELNDYLKQQNKQHLQVCYGTGYYKEYFTHGLNTHTWAALVREVDTYKARVDIDASLQTITHNEGYNPSLKFVRDVRAIERDLTLTIPTSPIRMFTDGGNTYHTVIGVSADFKYVYNLGFFKDESTRQPIPFIRSGGKDDTQKPFICFAMPRGNKLELQVNSYRHPRNQMAEASQLLEKAQQFVFKEVAEKPTQVAYVRF